MSAPGAVREIPVTVESIAAGGDGVARADGLVVFLPRTAPGDRGTASVTAGKSFGRGRMLVLEHPSPVRVEPPCAHYEGDSCGGCQLQHMQYAAQLDAKRRIVADSFARIARREVEVPHVMQNGGPWRYRTKLTLALRRRTGGEQPREGSLAPPHSPWVAGLRPYDDPAAVFQLHDCPISSEQLVDHWRAVLQAGHLLPDAPELRVSARLTSPGLALVVQGGIRWGNSRDFAASIPGLSELWWAAEGHDPVLLHGGTAGTTAELPDESLDMEPGSSFAQVNDAVAESVREWVLRLALSRDPRTAVDAYSGTGVYAARLAAAGVRVIAIERDQAAAAFARCTLPSPSQSVEAAVEVALPGALPADVVIVNPPRGGLHPRVAEVLSREEGRPAHLIYVSCNPATLARDTARLHGWRIASVQPFDMFPQTAHVEVVCEFVPEQR